MYKAWILIVWAVSYPSNPPSAIAMQEFSSEKTCVFAIAEIKKRIPQRVNYDAVCIPK